MAVVHFACPDCKQDCRLSEEQRGVQHSEPVCKTWRKHRGKADGFLQEAFMALGGAALILGGTADRDPGQSNEALSAQRRELLEQMHEGLKRLGR